MSSGDLSLILFGDFMWNFNRIHRFLILMGFMEFHHEEAGVASFLKVFFL